LRLSDPATVLFPIQIDAQVHFLIMLPKSGPGQFRRAANVAEPPGPG
jgi:hypothetical protein